MSNRIQPAQREGERVKKVENFLDLRTLKFQKKSFVPASVYGEKVSSSTSSIGQQKHLKIHSEHFSPPLRSFLRANILRTFYI